MKIALMHVTPIAITDPPLLNSVGIHAPYALRTVLELVTDDGISGVAEIPGGAANTRVLKEAADAVIDGDPFNLNAIRARLAAQFGPEADQRGGDPWDHRKSVHVQSAVEVACYDIMGKATGRPVADLLGGIIRERVPFAAYLFYKFEGAGGALGTGIDPAAAGWDAARQAEAVTPDQIVTQARAMCDEFGFGSIKLKGGVFEPEIEVESLFALRAAFGPDVPLRFDPNAVWSVETAIRWGEKLKGVIEYYEDPVHGQENMAQVRAALGIPMATNMATTSFDDLPASFALGAEDVILSDHHFWGGLRASLELAAICRTFGRGLSMHSNSHLGISLMAMVHLAAATPNLTYDLDTHYPWQSEEIIQGGRVQFEDGAVRVPQEPGLGVELDRDALARLHATYQRCGITERDDAGEMRKFRPDWESKRTRW